MGGFAFGRDSGLVFLIINGVFVSLRRLDLSSFYA